MYVRKLRLTNIRSIQSMEMSFTQAESPGWHVLLGANGAGKSHFLRLIAGDQTVVHEGSVRLVPQAHDAGFLEEDRRVLGEDNLLLGQLGRQGDRAGLPARERELRGIRRQAQGAGDASGPRLADVTNYTGHLGVAESFNTYFVIGADKFPGGRDAADGVSVSGKASGQQKGDREKAEEQAGEDVYHRFVHLRPKEF